MFQSKIGLEYLEKMNRVADLLIVSILWFVTSIPLATIGAATSALYRTVQTSIIDGEGTVWKTYWRAMKSSFMQATVYWLFYVFLIAVFGLNQLLLLNGLASSWMNQFSQIFLFMVVILYTPVLIYKFAYLSRFNDQLKTIGKNCVFFAVIHFNHTCMILFLVLLTSLFIYLVPILIVILPAFFMYKVCPRIEKMFMQYTTEMTET